MRYPCLITGLLLAVLLVAALATCRLVGLPVSNDAGTAQPAQESGATSGNRARR